MIENHNVSWIPERYVVDPRDPNPVPGIFLEDNVTEFVYLEREDEDEDDEFTALMHINGGYTDEQQNMHCNIITDTVEVPGKHVWYVWRTTDMLNSAEFTPAHRKQIDTGVLASMVGFLSARMETYRHQYPDDAVVTDVMWMEEPPYFH